MFEVFYFGKETFIKSKGRREDSTKTLRNLEDHTRTALHKGQKSHNRVWHYNRLWLDYGYRKITR